MSFDKIKPITENHPITPLDNRVKTFADLAREEGIPISEKLDRACANINGFGIRNLWLMIRKALEKKT